MGLGLTLTPNSSPNPNSLARSVAGDVRVRASGARVRRG